jgi:hypothetical protein
MTIRSGQGHGYPPFRGIWGGFARKIVCVIRRTAFVEPASSPWQRGGTIGSSEEASHEPRPRHRPRPPGSECCAPSNVLALDM